MSDIAQEQASALIQHFAEATSSVLSQIAGATLEAQPVSLESATAPATLICIDITGALAGLCEIALSPAMTAQFAALLTGETPEPAAEITNDTREAATELIQQICGNAADRLRRAFGPLELKPHPGERDAGSGPRQLFLINRENNALEFEFHVVRLVPEQKPDAAVPTAPQPVPQSTAQPGVITPQPTAQPPTPEPLASGNRNLDLLLDIELAVTLRFGSRQMMLKDIIELCSGSVVELDRGVQEPVDLLIDGRVIAQGEVVIVEGNYGLRILKVAAQADKIGCLP